MSRTHQDSWFKRLGRLLTGRAPQDAARRRARRHLRLESLEGRAVLASNLAAISGTIYVDHLPTGFNAGEQVAGATVNLFADDGDGVFEPNAGDGAPTAQVTNASGKYTFGGLTAGGYWVQQPAQVVGANSLTAQVSSLITITALQAQGVLGTTIDSFATTGPNVVVDAPTGNSGGSVQDAPEALGGERDLFAEVTFAGAAADNIQFRGILDFLDWSATATARGRYTATWDGNDDVATVGAPASTFMNVDLTSGGVSDSLSLIVESTDKTGGTVQVLLYSGDGNVSESQVIVLQQLNTNEIQEIVIPFSAFANAGGTGANPTAITAVQLVIIANEESMQGRIRDFTAIGPTVTTQDFSNTADLSLTKTVDNPTPAINANVVFTITVNNAGPANATNVAVTDQLPAGLQFVSATASQGSYNSATGVWTIGAINAGAAPAPQLQITAQATTTGLKLNAAEITGVDQVDPDSTPGNGLNEDDRGTASVTASGVDLSLTKTVNDSTPNVGQNVTFTITVNNAGPDGATGVAVNDQLPAGLTFVSSTASQGTYVSGTGIWTVGAIASGGQASLQVVATAATPGAKTNTAQVSAASPADIDSTPGNSVPTEDDQASVVVTPDVIDLSLTKTVDDATPDKNQNVTFTLTLANAGPVTATGITVTDVLPAGLTFVSSTPSVGSYNSATGAWTVASLANGANATLQIVATVATSGAKTNTAQVTAADQFDSDSTPNNNNGQEDDQASAALTPNVADLSLTKTVDNASPNKNTNVTFTITVSNAGPAGATNVAVADLLPDGLTFVSSTPSQGTYVSGTGVWTVGSIANGSSATLAVVATPTTAGAKTNTAQVSAEDQFDPDSTPNNSAAGEDDQASAVVTPAVADLSLTKTVNTANPSVNANVTFTITASNAGPTNATGVTVTDLLPAGFAFVSATPSVGTYDNTTGVWTVGALNNGASATLQIVATVTTSGAKTNVAEIATADQLDPDSTPGDGVAGQDDRASAVVTPQTFLSKRMFLSE